LLKIPHQFFKKEIAKFNIILRKPDEYVVGFFNTKRLWTKRKIYLNYQKILKCFNLDVFLRPVPTNIDISISFSNNSHFMSFKFL